MKRTIHILMIFGLLITVCTLFLSYTICAHAEEGFLLEDTDKLIDSLYDESGADDLMFSLPENAKAFLDMLYIDDFKPGSADKFGINNVVSALAYVLRENLLEPLRILVCIIGIIILTALFDTLKTSDLSAGLEQTLSFVSVLCMSAVLSPQMLGLIEEKVFYGIGSDDNEE